MMKFYNKNALWGFFIIIPLAFFFLFTPITAFAEGEDTPKVPRIIKQDLTDRENPPKNVEKKDGEDGKSETPKKTDENEPVTHKEFNEFKAQYAKESADKINKADAEKLIKEKTPDEDFLKLILACSAVGLVMAVVGLIYGVKVNGGLGSVISRNKDRDAQIKKLQSEIEELKQKLSKLSVQRETTPTAYIQPITETPKPESRKNVAPSRIASPVDPFADFLAEYHKLNNMSAYEGKEFRKKLFGNYRLKAFSCVNFTERMQNPSLPPVYADEDAAKAHVWAYPLGDGTFAVIPRLPQTYEERIHDEGSMGMIFDSNFASGKNYNKIEVVEPAVFGDGWRLQKKGRIILS